MSELPDDSEDDADIFLPGNDIDAVKAEPPFDFIVHELAKDVRDAIPPRDVTDGDSGDMVVGVAVGVLLLTLGGGEVQICRRQRSCRREPPRNLDT